MAARVITSFAEKGGVGKTTIAIMLAHGLAAIHGRNVLCIDLDDTPRLSHALMGVQGHAGAMVGSVTLKQLIAGAVMKMPVDPAPSIRTHVGMIKGAKGPAPISILAGDDQLTDQVNKLIGHLSRGNHAPGTAAVEDMIIKAIPSIVQSVRGAFDYVVIDAPPRDGLVLRGAIAASDLVLAPYEPNKEAGNVLADTWKITKAYSKPTLAIPNKVQAPVGFGHKSRVTELADEFEHLLDETGEVYWIKIMPQLAGLLAAPDRSDLTLKDRYASGQSVVKSLCELVGKQLHTKAKEAA